MIKQIHGDRGGCWCIMPLDQSQNSKMEWNESSRGEPLCQLKVVFYRSNYLSLLSVLCLVDVYFLSAGTLLMSRSNISVHRLWWLLLVCLFSKAIVVLHGLSPAIQMAGGQCWAIARKHTRRMSSSDWDPRQLIEVADDHPQLIGPHNPLWMSFVAPREEWE